MQATHTSEIPVDAIYRGSISHLHGWIVASVGYCRCPQCGWTNSRLEVRVEHPEGRGWELLLHPRAASFTAPAERSVA